MRKHKKIIGNNMLQHISKFMS